MRNDDGPLRSLAGADQGTNHLASFGPFLGLLIRRSHVSF
jgi:hypothetical protein